MITRLRASWRYQRAWVRIRGSHRTGEIRRSVVYALVARAIAQQASERVLRRAFLAFQFARMYAIVLAAGRSPFMALELADALALYQFSLLDGPSRRRARQRVRRMARRHPYAARLYASIASPKGHGNDGQPAYDMATRTWFGALLSTAGRPFFDVRAYAGPADPDQTQAVAAASQASQTAGGGIVYFSNGTFNVTVGSFIASNEWWLGAGWGAIIRRTANTGFTVFTAQNVLITNLKFDLGNFTFNMVSIQNGSSYCQVDTCWFTNGSNNADGVVVNASNFCRVCNSRFDVLLAAGVDFTNGTTSSSCVLNVFNGVGNATTPSIWVRQAGTNQNLVEGNIVVSAGTGAGGPYATSGMQADTAASATRIIGNYFNANGSTGILCNGSSSLVQGNISNNAPGGDGIDLGDANYCNVTGNWCYGNGWNGIEVNAFTAASARNVVSSNHCINNSQQSSGTYDGIVIQAAVVAACTEHVVTGNNCFDTQGAGRTQNYGINEKNGAVGRTDFNFIGSNDCRSNKTGTILLTGPSTIARSNPGFNPQGVAAIAVGGSPFTYTNGDQVDELVSIDGGTITTVVKNAITLFSFGGTPARCSVFLEPAEAVTVTYTVAPTMNKDRK